MDTAVLVSICATSLAMLAALYSIAKIFRNAYLIRLNRDIAASNQYNYPNLKFISISRARNHLKSLMNFAEKEGTVAICENGIPISVLMHIKEFTSIKAMLELSGDIERLSKVYSIDQEIRDGNFKDLRELTFPIN